MKLTFTFFVAFIPVFFTHAQDYQRRPWMPLESRVGLAIGIGNLTYLDKNSSPLIYQSKPKHVRLFYNLESNDFLFIVNLDVKVGSNAPKDHPYRMLIFREEDYRGKKEEKKFPTGGSFLAGKISVGAFYKIKSTQESTLKVAVGGSLTNELFYPQGWTTGGIFNSLNISPEAWTQHWVDEHHSFTASFRVPLVSYLARLPYDNTVSKPEKNVLGGFLDNAKWVGPKKFFAPSISIGYNYQINQNWGSGLNYEIGWYSIQQPQAMRAVSQSLLANFYHQF